jgi:sensor histidine kinase YesM
LGLLSLLLDLLAYCAIVGLAHAVHYYQRFREREHQALLLGSNLAQARLSALRAQLQPHFLFNSLNAIAALLRRDPRLAEATLMSLSELLRLALRQSEQQEVSLREELNLVECYLQIQQTRFGDRLRLEQQIDPATLDCVVPTLLLQPVVENAIRHGIEPGDKPGWVRLGAHRSNDRLVLTVADNGVGLDRSAAGLEGDSGSLALIPPTQLPTERAVKRLKARGTGIGLANLRARLDTLYGPRQSLDLKPREGGGVLVRIEIPWQSGRPADLAETAAAS